MVDTFATEEEPVLRPDERPRIPGLVLVSHAGAPICRAIDARTPVVIGREGACALDDRRASRRHAEVVWQSDGWHVRDLGSSNGTFVDGAPVRDEVFASPRVLRVGGSLFLFEPDLARFRVDAPRESLREGDYVLGPALRGVRLAAIDAADHGRSLLVTGESGAGKERVAEWYHHKGPRVRGPLVSLNCATLPKELAEALLFGAEKGAHSGAHASTVGHLREAHGGVLFLDEVAELAMEVQAKLLRAVETKTVLPLGATTPRPADVAFVSATNADVDAAIASGRFRHDLKPRLGQREVHIPPLRERPEEIPFLVDLALSRAAASPPPSARFVEACILRRWPLNVRELFIAVDRAESTARASGAKELSPELLPSPLEEGAASRPVAPASAAPALGLRLAATASSPPPAPSTLGDVKRAEIVAAYTANGFDVGKTASALGVSRATLYRWLGRVGLK